MKTYKNEYLHSYVLSALERKRDRRIDEIIDTKLSIEDTFLEIDKVVYEFNCKEKELQKYIYNHKI